MIVKIISFSWENFSNSNAHSVTLRTKEGEISVLDNHAPLTSILVPWVVLVENKDENGQIKSESFAIWWGVLEVWDNEVKILTDMLTTSKEANRTSAQEAIEKAKELMSQYKDSKDKQSMEKFIEAEDMLLKSLANLKLSDIKK